MALPNLIEVAYGAGSSSGGQTFTFAGAPAAGDLILGFITSPNQFQVWNSSLGGAFWTGGRFFRYGNLNYQDKNYSSSEMDRGVVGFKRMATGSEGVGPHTITGLGGSNYQVV